MISRKHILKTRYNFKQVLRIGKTYSSTYLLIKYANVGTNDNGNTKKFAVIASNKFSKKAVVQNRVRRLIFEAIREKFERFPDNYFYIFIPKKVILDKGGKVKLNVKDFILEINTFLSKMDISGSRSAK